MNRGRYVMLAVCLLLAGCDQDTFIDPFIGQDRYYTIYGFLDENETEHYLRVIPVRRTPEVVDADDAPQAFIDAEVYSTDLNTNIRTRWAHTLRPLSDGTYGHVFRADFIVVAGRRYRIEVERSDGKVTTAETKVPLFGNHIQPQPGPLEGAGDSLFQDVELPGVASLAELFVTYAPPIGTPVAIPYGRAGMPTIEGNWRFRINLGQDLLFLRATQGPGAIAAVGVLVKVLDQNWTLPPEPLDPDVLVQPGALSNVENGYGFWGSIGFLARDWPVSLQAQGTP